MSTSAAREDEFQMSSRSRDTTGAYSRLHRSIEGFFVPGSFHPGQKVESLKAGVGLAGSRDDYMVAWGPPPHPIVVLRACLLPGSSPCSALQALATRPLQAIPLLQQLP
jgi:hypothetical protein